MIAEVIHLLLGGDVPVEIGVGHQMGCYGLPVERHTSITTTSASTRVGAMPDEAGTGLSIDDETVVNDVCSCVKLLEDLFSAVLAHRFLTLEILAPTLALMQVRKVALATDSSVISGNFSYMR